MKTELIVTILIVVLALFLALFIGKISMIDGTMTIERPLTAIFSFLTIVFGYFNL